MASLAGVRCGGDCFLKGRLMQNNPNHMINAQFGPCSNVKISLDVSRCKRGRIRMATAAANREMVKGVASTGRSDEKAVVYEKVDEWMRDSVVEIVKNLREAPLLVHVYSGEESGGITTLKTEKAVAEENWPVLMERWKKKTQMPEGVIFVEKLEDDEEVEGEEEEITRAWGIVVQGKGVDCAPVCYLLKTSRAGSDQLGWCCTHFCLMKVKSFRETTKSQFKNCWLLQGR